MYKDILHAPLPAGPAGQFGMHLMQSHMLMKYSKNQDAAKEFLKWIHTEKNYEKWFHLAEGLRHAVHGEVGGAPAVDAGSGHGAVQGRGQARPGARLRRACPTKRRAEALSKYIITDMYAKAVQGMPAEEAVKWAEGELKKIYAS